MPLLSQNPKRAFHMVLKMKYLYAWKLLYHLVPAYVSNFLSLGFLTILPMHQAHSCLRNFALLFLLPSTFFVGLIFTCLFPFFIHVFSQKSLPLKILLWLCYLTSHAPTSNSLLSHEAIFSLIAFIMTYHYMIGLIVTNSSLTRSKVHDGGTHLFIILCSFLQPPRIVPWMSYTLN